MTYTCRTHDPDEIAKLNVQPWMIACLDLNPDYCHWGNSEDYMCEPQEKRGFGWGDSQTIQSPQDIWTLDNLNEVVHGYFYLYRNNQECPSCGGSGYNPATAQIANDWYYGPRWSNNITQDEVEALGRAGRLWDFFPQKVMFSDEHQSWVVHSNGKWEPCEPVRMPDAAAVNAWSKKGLGHDSINQHLCVGTRAKREGVWGYCPECNGDATVFTEPTGHLGLQLWYIHPRKGSSRGLRVLNVQQTDLPKIQALFKEASERAVERFRKLAGD